MNPYESLANAIVLRAAVDYRQTLLRCKKYPKKEAYQEDLDSIELFIHSDWFNTLTDIDPEILIRMLRQEVA